jgi:hypothetical protein
MLFFQLLVRCCVGEAKLSVRLFVFVLDTKVANAGVDA